MEKPNRCCLRASPALGSFNFWRRAEGTFIRHHGLPDPLTGILPGDFWLSDWRFFW